MIIVLYVIKMIKGNNTSNHNNNKNNNNNYVCDKNDKR